MPAALKSSPNLVLVADDDPLLVMLIEHHLISAGYKVISASDGEAALSLIRLESPAAVILDQMMPIMSGSEVLRHLKAEQGLSDLKVLMLTTLKSEDQVVSALKLGAADFLTKPFSPAELIARIDKLVPLAAA